MLPFSLPTFISFTYVLTFLFGVLINSYVDAQGFRPIAAARSSSVFVEGQGLYVFGGAKSFTATIAQAFMIDLSVSWNTSNPAFRKLKDGPGGALAPCTMTADGEEIFVLVFGVGHMYNLKSDTWRLMTNNKFPIGMNTPGGSSGGAGATDPESGFIYIANGPQNTTFRGIVMELDPSTTTVNTTPMPVIETSNTNAAAWSVPLRSMVFHSLDRKVLYTYTPSERNKPSQGWKQLNTTAPDMVTGASMSSGSLPCLVSAYGGSKMVFYGIQGIFGIVYILDVATLTWTKSLFYPGQGRHASACAVAGDQLVIWGGQMAMDLGTTNETLVYDMKAKAWVTSYTPPPLSTPTTTANDEEVTIRNIKLITIIVVSTGVLLMAIPIAVFLFLRRIKRLNGTSRDDSTSGPSDVKSTINANGEPFPKGTSGPCDPAYTCRNPTAVDVNTSTERNGHSPFVHAQTFLPAPASRSCSTFVEGQGLYVLGGTNDTGQTNQAFVLDLSVSWNAANPIFKKLPDILSADHSTCTMTSNGEILSTYGGFKLYNVKSSSKAWTQIPNSPTAKLVSATDPDSGLVYAINPSDKNHAGSLFVANLKTMTFKNYSLPAMSMSGNVGVAWSSPLRSLLLFADSNYIFTPSNVNNSSHGWKELITAGANDSDGSDVCFMSAYNGSKIVVYSAILDVVLILDVATMTWSFSTSGSIEAWYAACAISGDQVIIWGGENENGFSNKTYIYNMKTDAWTSRYISPSDTQASTSVTTSLQTPTQHSSSTNAYPSVSMKTVLNVAIAAGVIVVTVLVAAYVYTRYKMREMSDTKSSTDTHGSVSNLQNVDKEPLEGSHRPKGPSYLSHDTREKATGQEGRLQKGSFGAQGNLEHPHAVV
ncbi:hypothetical protein BGX31_004902 [Mortierella sp. GBA43]|nr:hypothetical protein BGX31_004902 [Mortierella sp. GBA43]